MLVRDDDADGIGGLGLRPGGRGRLLGGGGGRRIAVVVTRTGGQDCHQREGEKQDRHASRGPHYDTVSHLSLSFPGQGGSPEPIDHVLVLGIIFWRTVAGEGIIVCQLPSAVMQRSQVT